jgi:hypothetical protein
VEVKIGVRDVAREVVVETEQSHDEVAAAVTKALDAGSVLRLVDTHGRVVLVPAGTIGYIEIGAPEARRVGFGTL